MLLFIEKVRSRIFGKSS